MISSGRLASLLVFCAICTKTALADDIAKDWVTQAQGDTVYCVMNKEKNELSVHSLKDGKLYGQFRAISGLNPGDKEHEGDRKTPEGIYFVSQKIDKSRLLSLHGPAAFELNYPNTFDRFKKHTGSGIWVHGVEREDRLQKGTDTRGCIALSNTDILEAAKLFHFGETPVVIIDKEVPGQALGLEAPDGPYNQRLKSWVLAWASKDPEAYLAFYDENFHSRGMNLRGWKNYKTRLAKTYKRIDIRLDDIKIIVHAKYAVATFDQDYSSDRFHSASRKRLYLIGPAAESKILAEEVVFEKESASDSEKLTLSQDQ